MRSVFIFRRVVDSVLAGELRAALGIRLIDAHGSRGQRHSEAAFLVVFEPVIHFHWLRNGVSDSLRVAIEILLALDRKDISRTGMFVPSAG